MRKVTKLSCHWVQIWFEIECFANWIRLLNSNIFVSTLFLWTVHCTTEIVFLFPFTFFQFSIYMQNSLFMIFTINIDVPYCTVLSVRWAQSVGWRRRSGRWWWSCTGTRTTARANSCCGTSRATLGLELPPKYALTPTPRLIFYLPIRPHLRPSTAATQRRILLPLE